MNPLPLMQKNTPLPLIQQNPTQPNLANAGLGMSPTGGMPLEMGTGTPNPPMGASPQMGGSPANGGLPIDPQQGAIASGMGSSQTPLDPAKQAGMDSMRRILMASGLK
jgi:hypothetical protein